MLFHGFVDAATQMYNKKNEQTSLSIFLTFFFFDAWLAGVSGNLSTNGSTVSVGN